jgi:aminoglycoside/choline kinase family phosphotransferase
VYRTDPKANLLFLEDAGDTMLEDAVRDHGVHGCLPLYEQCVEILVRIQSEGTRALDGQAIPPRLSFDVAKFTEEIDFFLLHAVREFGAIALSDREERAIRDLFLPFLEQLSSFPRVLTHRDYHGRNVMVIDPAQTPGHRNLRVLDFQDARMGPDTYDLVSLLRDSYVDIGEDDVQQYIAYFLALKGSPTSQADLAEFTRRFDLMALQRNLKALGTFGYQTAARGNPVYIQYMPRTLRHARTNLVRHARFARLRELLALYVEELR